MHTSWKVGAGVVASALLAYWIAGTGKPESAQIVQPAASEIQRPPVIESARQDWPEAPRLPATPAPKKSAPVTDDPDCTTGCFEQESGYNWAEKTGVDDPVDCDSESPSFVEGCQVYAEAQQASVDDSWE